MTTPNQMQKFNRVLTKERRMGKPKVKKRKPNHPGLGMPNWQHQAKKRKLEDLVLNLLPVVIQSVGIVGAVDIAIALAQETLEKLELISQETEED